MAAAELVPPMPVSLLCSEAPAVNQRSLTLCPGFCGRRGVLSGVLGGRWDSRRGDQLLCANLLLLLEICIEMGEALAVPRLPESGTVGSLCRQRGNVWRGRLGEERSQMAMASALFLLLRFQGQHHPEKSPFLTG